MNLSMWRFLQGDVNTGGIVAGVIVALLLLALLGLAIWYANRKGYLPSEFSTLYLNHGTCCDYQQSVLTLTETMGL